LSDNVTKHLRRGALDLARKSAEVGEELNRNSVFKATGKLAGFLNAYD